MAHTQVFLQQMLPIKIGELSLNVIIHHQGFQAMVCFPTLAGDVGSKRCLSFADAEDTEIFQIVLTGLIR